jgi:hypothetical protein
MITCAIGTTFPGRVALRPFALDSLCRKSLSVRDWIGFVRKLISAEADRCRMSLSVRERPKAYQLLNDRLWRAGGPLGGRVR